MKAMILAAGRGTRLRPLTEKIPKPMIPISSEPLIVHQLRWLKRAGIVDVVINLHHFADQIRGHLGSGRQFGVRISYSEEEALLETGGGIVNALELLGDEEFVVLNGDIWTAYRFQRTVQDLAATMHLILVPKPPHRDHGDFALAGVHALRHEDPLERPYVYSGIAFVKPEVLRDEPLRAFSLNEVMFRESAARRVTGELFDGIWHDIGTHEQLKVVRRLML
ncbi:MAG: nucleotidyltransferase family protein [Gammaproteobacteria bacterium]|nr:nucleotidyltransferase family protein [Gammaproteobacteria bacterium]